MDAGASATAIRWSNVRGSQKPQEFRPPPRMFAQFLTLLLSVFPSDLSIFSPDPLVSISRIRFRGNQSKINTDGQFGWRGRARYLTITDRLLEHARKSFWMWKAVSFFFSLFPYAFYRNCSRNNRHRGILEKTLDPAIFAVLRLSPPAPL